MKKLAIVLIISLYFSSCQQDNVTPASNSKKPVISDLPKIIDGNWKVSSLTEVAPDKTEDKAGLFSKVIFSFSADGKIIAKDDKTTLNGTWNKGEKVYYGLPTGLSEYSFTIILGASKPYDRISQHWIITEMTTTSIKFDHNNPAENKHMILTKL